MQKICGLIPYLSEIHLDDIKFHNNKDVMRTIVSTLFQNGKNLLSLKISNINLNDDLIVEKICGIINSKYEKFVHYIELVACSLTPKNMCKIIEEIRYCHYNIRNLNLSYNPLCLSET